MDDPVGMIVTELRDGGLASGRVAAGEAKAGWAKEPGKYQRFVVLVKLGRSRIGRAPVQVVRLGARCYGVTWQDAGALYGELSDALHLVGPRIGTGGVGIYITRDDGGGTAEKDPDTDQPYEIGVIELFATTDGVAV
jgi:hypothetical protein